MTVADRGLQGQGFWAHAIEEAKVMITTSAASLLFMGCSGSTTKERWQNSP
jgi:hypothetical protein